MNKKIIWAGAISITVLLGSWATSLSYPDIFSYKAQGQATVVAPEQVLPQNYIATQPSSQAQEQSIATNKASDKSPETVKQSVEVAKPETATVTSKPETKTPVIQGSRSQGTPRVTGSAAFKASVNKALMLLQEKAPEHANKVSTYLQEIRESDHSGVIVQTGVFNLGRNTVTGQDTYWLASVIVHDAYHAELYQRGQDYAGKEAEAQCIAVQKTVLKKMGAAESYQTHLDQILESNYWEVPFEQRNW